MKFSDNDLQVLTNFSVINNNIKFEKGKIIRTTSGVRDINAQYLFDTTITENFCLYSLSEFLNFYDLYEDPTISIIEEISNQHTKEKYKKILIKDKRFSTEYSCADESVILVPSRTPDDYMISKGLEYQFNFHLDKNDIKDINRIKSKIPLDKLKHTTFENKDGNISIKVRDNNNQISFLLSGDSFLKNKTNHKFKLILLSEKFNKILVGDYYVECLVMPDDRTPDKKSGVIKLTSRNLPLTYWIALEPGSEFDTNEEVKTNA